MKTLYLIGGPMGVGKTTVGEALKNELPQSIYLEGDYGWNGIPFVLNEENKKKVINNIIGMINDSFTKYENVILGWVMDQQKTIDSIVNGLYENYIKVVSISLVAQPYVIKNRLQKDINSGKRKDDGVIERSLKRLPLFSELNTRKIDTTYLNVEEIVEEIKK